jgi:hypothetical protein
MMGPEMAVLIQPPLLHRKGDHVVGISQSLTQDQYRGT